MQRAELLKEIYRQNPWFSGGRLEFKRRMVERDRMSELRRGLDEPNALAVVGLRRSGKTTLLRLLIRELLEEHDPKNLLYFSFDMSGQMDIKAVLDIYEEEILQRPFKDVKERAYVLFDEVQKIDGWGDQVKSFIDKEYPLKFILSGSSSMHMTKGAGESLIGRVRILTLHPFSFTEFLRYREITPPKISLEHLRYPSEPIPLKKAFKEYMKLGGLPEMYDPQTADLLGQNLDLTFFRDIVEIFPVKRADVLKSLFLLIAQNSGQRVNYEKMSRDLKTQFRTVSEYVQHLKDSYLVSTSQPYGGSLASSLRKGEKAYVSDHAYLNLVDCLVGLRAETIAFNHLRKQGKVFYVKDPEIDIMLPENKMAIEVKFGQTVERSDCANLLVSPKENRLFLITDDVYEKWTFEGRTVTVLPLWLLCVCSD